MLRAAAVLFAGFLCTVSAGIAPAAVIAGPALAAAPVSYASGPALGAPLLGRVSYSAPEVNVVKQPITIDQPEIRYRAVPTLVQPQVAYISHQPAAVVAAQPAAITLAAHPAPLTLAAQPAAVTLAHQKILL